MSSPHPSDTGPTLEELERKTRAAGGTDRDVDEVLAFSRFLALGARPALPGQEVARGEAIPQGWVPYVLGLGPAPPDELDDVRVTAWTMPA